MSIPRKLRCTVESVTDHGGRVYTVDLAPRAPVPSFRPGQFLHLTVDDYDPASFWPDSRVFSIASSPRERNRLRICYAVKGRYTSKMERELKVGSEAWVKLPYGEFVIDDSAGAVLIAGGTGISAFTAFLEGLTLEARQPVTLVYGARTPALFLFQEMILGQLAKVAKFNVIFFSESADAAFSQRLAALPRVPACYTGCISLDALFEPVSPELGSATSGERPPSRAFYLSGPPAMLRALGANLKTRGVEADKVRTDAWE